MTAEVAILNKAGIALAADSAATISAGNVDEKIFNSEDKLFQLSDEQPMAVMIYNGTSFLDTPLQILIKDFRSRREIFDSVDEAAERFRAYLNDFGRSLDRSVRDRSVKKLVNYIIDLINARFSEKMEAMFISHVAPRKGQDPAQVFEDMYAEAVDFYRSILLRADLASIHGPRRFAAFNVKTLRTIREQIEVSMPRLNDIQKNSLLEVACLFLRKDMPTSNSTGIVIAGYAHRELFPSLRSFEIDGMVCRRTKYMGSLDVDINFGVRARVLPFAQRDMVERFVYGLDQKSRDSIEDFCRERLASFSSDLLSSLTIKRRSDRFYLESLVSQARDQFIRGLKEEAFAQIKNESEKEIQDVVEFMPKPELAQMAESLVEITSIKRRVSRGFETVGGPIDVAVISRSDGFVWVKRKHYFPAELNARYLKRVAEPKRSLRGIDHADDRKAAKGSEGRGRSAAAQGKSRRDSRTRNGGRNVSKPESDERTFSSRPESAD